MQRIAEFNRRTLDALAARVYFYWAWTTEKTGELSNIRGRLLALHRTAVLRHDEYGQETVLNLLLRNYLHYNQYEQVGAGWVSSMGAPVVQRLQSDGALRLLQLRQRRSPAWLLQTHDRVMDPCSCVHHQGRRWLGAYF